MEEDPYVPEEEDPKNEIIEDVPEDPPVDLPRDDYAVENLGNDANEEDIQTYYQVLSNYI